MTRRQPPEQSKTVFTLPPDEVTDRFAVPGAGRAPPPAPQRPRHLVRRPAAAAAGRRARGRDHAVALVLARTPERPRAPQDGRRSRSLAGSATIALNVTGVLDTVSGWLLLDQPRSLTPGARPGARATTRSTRRSCCRPRPARSPAATTARGTKVTPPPPKPHTARSNKLRVWVAGDSLSIVPGLELDQLTSSNPVMTSLGWTGASPPGWSGRTSSTGSPGSARWSPSAIRRPSCCPSAATTTTRT